MCVKYFTQKKTRVLTASFLNIKHKPSNEFTTCELLFLKIISVDGNALLVMKNYINSVMQVFDVQINQTAVEKIQLI